jgi:hypothetical protein
MAIRLDHLIVPSRDAPLRRPAMPVTSRRHFLRTGGADLAAAVMSRSIAPELVKPADVKEYYEVR